MNRRYPSRTITNRHPGGQPDRPSTPIGPGESDGVLRVLHGTFTSQSKGISHGYGTHSLEVDPGVVASRPRGALLGVVAAVVMGMFAMIASATYRDTGFFTPLHHIASAVIEPTAMMRSMEAGSAGDTFAISVGPALLGLALHLATGAFWGAIFGLLVSTGWLRGVTGLVGGIVYVMAAMLVMTFLGLPVITAAFGGGEPVSDMPRLAGWVRSRSSTRSTARCSGCGRCSRVPSSGRGMLPKRPGYEAR
jgi:hypothetical protein